MPMAIDHDDRKEASDVLARAWQRMLSGRRLDLLEPSSADIEFEDIAHGLARLARWNGQTVGAHAFSVAQHVLIVEEIAGVLNPDWGPTWRLAALLHDSPEYVIGDLISPFKTAIGLDYKTFELKLLDAIHRRFNVPVPLPVEVAREIKRADRIAAFFEATGLAGFSIEEAQLYFGTSDGIPEPLRRSLCGLSCLSANQAQSFLLSRFSALTRAV
jgi:5'-nucleotidase